MRWNDFNSKLEIDQYEPSISTIEFKCRMESQWLLYRETNPQEGLVFCSHVTNNKHTNQVPLNDTSVSEVTFSAATWSPWRGDLYGAQVVRRLVCGRSYKVVVEAIVAEFEQLHEQTVLRLIVQVQVLPRSLETNKHSASINRSLQETTY